MIEARFEAFRTFDVAIIAVVPVRAPDVTVVAHAVHVESQVFEPVDSLTVVNIIDGSGTGISPSLLQGQRFLIGGQSPVVKLSVVEV